MGHTSGQQSDLDTQGEKMKAVSFPFFFFSSVFFVSFFFSCGSDRRLT